jgi:sporulation protein YlmC with PRC-barrel domain
MDKPLFNSSSLNKSMLHIWGIIISLALSGAVLAANQDLQQHTGQEKAKTQEQASGQAAVPSQDVHRIYKASELLDKPVKNKKGEDLGKITELVIDKSGQVKYAVLSHGGLLDMGAKMTAVSWKALQIFSAPSADKIEHYILKLNITKEQLAGLPTFSDDNWPSEAQLTEHSTLKSKGAEQSKSQR